MVNILDPREGESIYDPACGTGGMLLEGNTQVI
jgi:type I restriction enzyme M protein